MTYFKSYYMYWYANIVFISNTFCLLSVKCFIVVLESFSAFWTWSVMNEFFCVHLYTFYVISIPLSTFPCLDVVTAFFIHSCIYISWFSVASALCCIRLIHLIFLYLTVMLYAFILLIKLDNNFSIQFLWACIIMLSPICETRKKSKYFIMKISLKCWLKLNFVTYLLNKWLPFNSACVFYCCGIMTSRRQPPVFIIYYWYMAQCIHMVEAVTTAYAWRRRISGQPSRFFWFRWLVSLFIYFYVDGLVQDCSNSSALAIELLQFCTKPLMYQFHF